VSAPARRITSATMLPLSAIVVLAGGILWVTTMHANLSHASSELLVIKQDLKDIVESRWAIQRSIDQRLSQIEGKLDILVLRFESPHSRD
jgi:hypothetical protein